MKNTVSGGLKGSLSSNVNALGTLYQLGQGGRDRNNRELMEEYGYSLERAKSIMTAMVEENQKTPGSWSASDIQSQQNIIDDWQRKYDAMAKVVGEKVQEKATRATYELADKVQASGAADVEKAKQGLGTAGKILVDAGASMTQTAMDAGTNLLLGTPQSMAPFALRAFGGGTQSARQELESKGQEGDLGGQVLYGAASAAKEILTEKLFNVALPFSKAYGGGALDDALQRGIQNAVEKFGKTTAGKKLLNAGLNLATSAVTEGMEEFIGDWMEWQMPRLYGGDVDSVGETLSNSLYDFLVGAAAGAGGAVITPGTYRYESQTGQQTEGKEVSTPSEQNVEDTEENAREAEHNARPAEQNAENANRAAGQEGQTGEPPLVGFVDSGTDPLSQPAADSSPARGEPRAAGQAEQPRANVQTIGKTAVNSTNLEETGRRYGVSEDDIQQVKRIADATQRKIVFFSQEGTKDGMRHGWYDPETGIIGVNARSENPVAQVISHELTHSVESAQAYHELSGLVLTKLSQSGKSLKELRAGKKAEYARNGVTLSTDQEVDRELVAEYVEKYLLTDEQSITELAQQNRSLVQKILDWINHQIAKLGIKKAQERDFILRVRNTYSRALNETPGGVSATNRSRMRLRQAYRAGEITEEEFDAALDDIMQEESRRGESVLTLQNSISEDTAWQVKEERRDEAERLAMQGVDSDTIQQMTGWFYDEDRQWHWMGDDSDFAPETEEAVAETGATSYTETTRKSTEEGDYYGRKGTEQEVQRGMGENDPGTASRRKEENRAAGRTGLLQTVRMLSRGARPVHSWAEEGLIAPEAGSVAENEARTASDEYGLSVFVVRDDVFDRNHTTAPAFASGGQVYLRATLPEIGRGDIGAHEAGHAMKQLSYRPYLDFLERTQDMLNGSDVANYLLEAAAGHTGIDLFNMSEADVVNLFDEISDMVMGAHHAGQDEVLGIVREAFDDFDGYLSELTTIHEAFKRRTGTQTAAENTTQEWSSLPRPEEKAASMADSLPTKARNYLEQAERGMAAQISKKLSIPRYADSRFLGELTRKISEEYLRSGTVSQETLDELSGQAYDKSVAAKEDFYGRYKSVGDWLHGRTITVGEQARSGIAHFDSLRKNATDLFRIVDEGGTPVEDIYRELHKAVPELFPEGIEDPGKQLQRVFNVARSIQKTGHDLTQHYNGDAENFRKWAQNDFQAAVMDTLGELRNVKRYAEDRQRRAERPKEKAAMTQDEAAQAYQQLKQARRDYEKTAAKHLLTEQDEMKIGELLRGQTQLENLDPETDNVRGITAVYEARKEYERIAKLLKEYKSELRKKSRERADGFLATSGAWKDKKAGIMYARETMERNIRDIVPDRKLANSIIEAYFTPVHESEAASTRSKNKYRDRVRGMGLSRKVAEGNEVSEAHAVQLLGEAEDNIRMLERSKGRMEQRDGKSLEDWKGVVTELWEQNPNLDQAKINAAVKEFRAIYDELFEQMNQVRVRNGYEPVNYRSGYFPHFQKDTGDGILAQFGNAMGIDTQVTGLPTTINGMTHAFKPGITWFGNTQERLGFATAYDAVEGFDKYIEGVMDVIHHTDNIQNLRALASQIRYRASDEGIKKQIDAVQADSNLTEEQKDVQIAAIQNEAEFNLNNFVVALDEYTNLLANKKSHADRNMEQLFGRGSYVLVKNLESRVAANMVAPNVGSWLTNFIPITQGAASLDSGSLLSGMWDTLKAIKTKDGFVERSAFLTNRRGSDPIVKTWSEKVSGTIGKPMEWIDSFTSDSLVRARYYQNLKNKMSEEAAMREADAWAAKVMADRSKGSTPTLFSQKNPITKMFTQFQLEVNNQFSYLIKDLPDEAKEKGIAALGAMLLKFFVGEFLYNEIYEYFFGRRPALDPIGILNDTVGDLTGYELPNLLELAEDAAFGDGVSLEDFQTEKKGAYEAAAGFVGSVAEELPFVGGVLGGGRIPISSALPDVENLGKAILNDEWDGKKRAFTAAKELANPLAYGILPFGGGQIKKVIQGAEAVAKRGSYSVDSKGNDTLQYPVYADTPLETAANYGRAMVFGKSTLPEAADWVERGFTGLNAKETTAYRDLMDIGMTGRESYGLLSEMKTKEKGIEKLRVAADAELTNEEFKIAAGLVLGTDMKTEEGNPSQYAKMLDVLNSGATVNDYVDMKEAGGIESYLECIAKGVDRDHAIGAAKQKAEIKAQAGKDATSLQRYRAVVEVAGDEYEQLAALRAMMTDAEYQRLFAGFEAGVDPDQYVEAKERIAEINDNENVSQDEATRAIAGMQGLTMNQRAALWQIQNKSWNAKNNPFSTSIGARVKRAMEVEDTERDQ